MSSQNHSAPVDSQASQAPPAPLPPRSARASSQANSTNPPPLRQKSKAYSTTIAAHSDDMKYRGKYKDLKRKVKEIESDNDKLHLKVLKSKRNIQRLRLERAILYERLAALGPTTPPISETHPSNVQHPTSHPNHHAPSEYQHHPEPGVHARGPSASAVDALAMQNLAVQALIAARERPDVDMNGVRHQSADVDAERGDRSERMAYDRQGHSGGGPGLEGFAD
ncbi:hypothetical protein BOTBODRAFT_59089 [Botryobasidium botryosum FD-172 SS1]|uniref:INO80 complex subunit F domain-containing protein n=1 Tax=Botryobasidium botryosum (strain FD-172 SS1) TaxID=930990 RepID=A0A067MBC6_BOTB1|nr:hypothetical protein BOTBODRAFT_59089 [Botryobasidium botryosum FD-172 SS1]